MRRHGSVWKPPMIPEQGRKPTRPACGPPNSEGAIMLPMPLRGEPTGSSAGGAFHNSPKGMRFWELAGCLIPQSDQLVSTLGLSRCKTKFSGGNFPLPETLEGLKTIFHQLPDYQLQMLRMACVDLNSYFGVKAAKEQTVAEASRQELAPYR